jgi:DNA-binding response OmpR family regulator
MVVLDAASMRTTGTRICRSIQSRHPGLPVILINDQENLPANSISADIQLVLPFTLRKLINRVHLFAPGNGKELLCADPIQLDMDRQIISCGNCEEHVTPLMADLLKMLIKNKGEVLDRKKLFSKVWKTTYAEDTRSLDVHISWLRKIIEEDPKNPSLLLTVRGVGYKLDL